MRLAAERGVDVQHRDGEGLDMCDRSLEHHLFYGISSLTPKIAVRS